MDYAVKEIKGFDSESYAIEKKILALGNSTWNYFQMIPGGITQGQDF